MMLSLPFLGLHLYGDHLIEKSALLGGTLQSVGQVVAGASLLDASVVQFAMLFKILRIMMLVAVVYLFEKFIQKKTASAETISSTVPKKRRFPLPWYVLGFLVFCLLNSLFTLPTFIDKGAHFISNWFEITALAAIGLRLDFNHERRTSILILWSSSWFTANCCCAAIHLVNNTITTGFHWYKRSAFVGFIKSPDLKPPLRPKIVTSISGRRGGF